MVNGKKARGMIVTRISILLGMGAFLFIFGCAAPPSDVPDPGSTNPGDDQSQTGTDPGTDPGAEPGSGTKPGSDGTQTLQYNFGFSKRGLGQVQPSAGTYDEGTTITVTAAPEAGWLFDHWEGDLAGTANSVAVAMNGNKYVVAVFAEQSQVATPVLSVETNTHFIDTLNVEVTCPTPDAEIYYTLDESEPTQSSTRYTEVIVLTTSVTVKARAFKKDKRPSEITSGDYYAMQVPGS